MCVGRLVRDDDDDDEKRPSYSTPLMRVQIWVPAPSYPAAAAA